MEKRFMCAMIAVISIVFTAATVNVSAAVAKKAPAKSVPAAKVNPLVGSWTFFKRGINYKVTFAADKVLFIDSSKTTVKTYEMKYKFSASPLNLEFKGESGKVQKLSLTYSIKDDLLTYRFLKTNNKAIAGLPWQFSQDIRNEEQVDADIVAEKVKAEAAAEVKSAEETKAAVKKTSGNPLVGPWLFRKGNTQTKVLFTADKLVFDFYSENGNSGKYEMKYKFSASPLNLEFKNDKGKVLKLSMSYKIKDDNLTYRFLKTNNKPIPGMPWEISQVRNGDAGISDGDTIAERDGRKAIDEAKPEEKKAVELASPNLLIGLWIGSNKTFDSEIRIAFTDEKAVFTVYPGAGDKRTFETGYRYGDSSIVITYKNGQGKTSAYTMTYKINGDTLTYRFPQGAAEFEQALFLKRINPDAGTTAITDIELNKFDK